MYRPKSKKRAIAKRIFVYSFMTISVVSIVTVLIMVMIGYRFNKDDGSLSQGGLMQFTTQPNGSTVTVDGQQLSAKTTTKTTLTAAEHDVVIRQDGYREWRKTVTVRAGGVSLIDYVRLIPTNVEQQHIKNFSTLASALASDDGRWMAIKQSAGTSSVIMADLRRDTPSFETVALPAISYTQPSAGQTQQFKLVEWDNSERYLLISHVYDGTKSEWIVMDRENPDQARNITKSLSIEATQVEFASDDGQTYFVLEGQNIRRLNLGSRTISAPLVTGVASFSLSATNQKLLTYVSVPDVKTGSRHVGYYRDGNDRAYLIRTYAKTITAPLSAAIGEYMGSTYTAISSGETVEILKGTLPTTSSTSPLRVVSQLVLAGDVEELTFKGEGRFVYAKSGAQYATYDIEQDEVFTTTLATSEVSPKIEWLDNFMVWTDFGNKLQVYEFDGGNHQVLSDVAAGYDATLSPNGRFIYSFIKTADGQFALQQARLNKN